MSRGCSSGTHLRKQVQGSVDTRYSRVHFPYTFSMIHVILGPDYFLAHEHMLALLTAMDPDGLATTRFDAGTSATEIATAIGTPGFFGAGRVIVATGLLGRSSGGDKAEKLDTAVLERLAASRLSENSLILYDIARESLPKSAESALGKVEVFAARSERGPRLVQWTVDRAAKLGGSLDDRTAVFLLQRLFPDTWQSPGSNARYDAPPDLQALVSELEKLVTAAVGRAIEQADIEDLVNVASADRLFPYLGAIMAGRADSAFRETPEMGGDDDSAARVINMLAANTEMGLVVAESEFDPELRQTAKELGVQNPGRLYNIRRDLPGSAANRLASRLLSSERRLKCGKVRSPGAQLLEIILGQTNESRGR
jgi:DNA polymerase III delta subunit